MITREEYEGLFNAIVRLTDRIEALEAKLGPFEETVLCDTSFNRTVLSHETPPA